MKSLLKIVIIAFLSVYLITILKSCKKITLPDVTTENISGITQTSAVSGGNVTNNGGAEVFARGVCWGTSENPTTGSSKTNNGEGNGAFASNITGLTANLKYYVRAYATNSEGTNYGDEVSFTTLETPPVAAFTASVTTIIAGQSVQFTDQSSNTPTSWSWNFGDGSTSTLQSPSHTYSTAGTYTISLIATNSSGSDTETKTGYIKVNPVVIAPVAAFTVSVTIITAGQSVQFTDQSTNTPTSWSWNFGDGGTSTTNSPLHIYSTAGTYTVSLTATNSAGSDTETKVNYITANAVLVPVYVSSVIENATPSRLEITFNLALASITPATSVFTVMVNSVARTVSSISISGTKVLLTLTSPVSFGDALTVAYTKPSANPLQTASGGQVATFSNKTVTNRVNTIIDGDGNTYNAVIIGTQVWMKENLKTTKYRNGTDIPLITSNTGWSNMLTPAYCWVNNDESTYKNTYGGLYNWYAVNTGILCPSGWHVPGDNEWKILEMHLGMSQAEADALLWRGTDQGAQMKNTSGWPTGDNGTNSSGFSGLPGGFRKETGEFVEYITDGTWWTSSPYGDDFAWMRGLRFERTQVGKNNKYKNNGLSVRCIKD